MFYTKDVLLWLFGSVDLEESSDRDDTTLPASKHHDTDTPLPTSTKCDSITN